MSCSIERTKKLEELADHVAWTIEHWDMMRDPKYRGDTRWELCESAAFSHRELSRINAELNP